jgi:hypothetical protein
MQVTLAGRNFDAGYKSDIARDQLPVGSAYRMFDYIPQLGMPLRCRGGWGYATQNLNALSACNDAEAVAWAPFSLDPHLIVIADNGKLYNDKLLNGSASTYVGTTGFASITHRPFWFADLQGMVVLPPISQAAPPAPQKYIVLSGAGPPATYQVTALGGSPPLASVGAAYGDWLLLANGWIGSVRYPNRIWASGVGTPEVWTNTQNFFDLPEEIVRVIPLRTLILVFGYRNTWIITGTTPPPGGDWTEMNAFSYGTMDGRSCVYYRDTVIFANNSGIYQTDGATLTDLTEEGGVRARWRQLVSTFNFSTGWSAAAGMYGSTYLIVVHDAQGNFVTCQVCDVDLKIWYEFTNIKAQMFAERQSGPGTSQADGHEELFFAHTLQPRACAISGCWVPTIPSDADGMAVLPVVETPFYKLGYPGLKQFRSAWITHDLRPLNTSSYNEMRATWASYTAVETAVSSYTALYQYWDGNPLSPEYQIDAMLTPNASGGYISLGVPPPVPVPKAYLQNTMQQQRRKVWVRKRSLGVALRIAATAASSDSSLAEIEFEARPLTPVRRG